MYENNKKHKMDENMAMIKAEKFRQENNIVSREERRKKLIEETMKENHEALERLSRI